MSPGPSLSCNPCPRAQWICWLTASNQDEADPIETTFELNDTLFAKAEVPPTDEVYIWLGANVMLAYPTDEAETLLVERLGKAKKSLEDCEEDAEFLREQITVSSRFGHCYKKKRLPILTPCTRPWRWQRPGCTIGTSCRSARRRARRIAKRRTTRPVVAERAARGGGEGVSAKRPVVLGSSRRRAETFESSRDETPRPACRAIHGLNGQWSTPATRTGPSSPAKST